MEKFDSEQSEIKHFQRLLVGRYVEATSLKDNLAITMKTYMLDIAVYFRDVSNNYPHKSL